MSILSYIITAITLIGTVANSLQKIWCFYIWIPTNLFWAVYNIIIGQYAQAVLYTVNAATSVIGLVRWSRAAKNKKPR